MYCLILSCSSVFSTLCIVWYCHALMFLVHYVLFDIIMHQCSWHMMYCFEIGLTNTEALSIQVNTLNSICQPLTLTWHDSSKPEVLKIILPVAGVKIDGDFLPYQSDTEAWDDDDVGSMSHIYFFSPGCLITWWNNLIVWTTIDSSNAIFPIGLNKIFLMSSTSSSSCKFT